RIKNDQIKSSFGYAGPVVCGGVPEFNRHRLAGQHTANVIERCLREVCSQVILAMRGDTKQEETCPAANFEDPAWPQCKNARHRAIYLLAHFFRRNWKPGVGALPARYIERRISGAGFRISDVAIDDLVVYGLPARDRFSSVLLRRRAILLGSDDPGDKT